MTGFLTTATGEKWQLPALLQWEVLRTDGDGCDSARVVFRYEPARLDVLKQAVYLRLEEGGKTEFFGVVDEFTAVVGEDGRRVDLSARGLMAQMLDSQLRAAEFSSFGEKDAESRLLRPFGITKVEHGNLPTLRNFAWDTGTTPWQALCGYCRHAGGVRPRFSADGTLLLQPKSGNRWSLTDNCPYTGAKLRQRRYGVVAQQVVVSAGGKVETAENGGFRKFGGMTQKVAQKTGKHLKASWRTAQQRLEESMEEALTVTVTVPKVLEAEPGDVVALDLKTGGFSGEFTLRQMKKTCTGAGFVTELVLEGRLC